MFEKTLFPLTISDTDISLLSSCPLKWFRTRCQWLATERSDINLIAGGGYAKALETARVAYYQEGKSAEDAINLAIAACYDDMNKYQISSTELKSPERMAVAVQTYFKQFPLDSDEVTPVNLADGTVAVELDFALELPIQHPELDTNLIFKGKLDMLASFRGSIYVFDDKTSSGLFRIKNGQGVDYEKEAAFYRTASQFIGYSWAAREMGVKTAGAIVRKAAITTKNVEIAEIVVPMSPFLIDTWYETLLVKLREAVKNYRHFMVDRENVTRHFLPDFKHGCTEYFRPCGFMEGCVHKNGTSSFAKNFVQQIYDPTLKATVSVEAYRKSLGLDGELEL